MAKKGEYNVNELYQGGYSALEPGYGDVFTGYRVSPSQLGAPTKPDTANQIAQVNMLLNQGIIPIEVGALSPEVFDQIPKQHFKEINRMAKLTGADISVHAPIIEASGIDEHGWDESARQLAEKQLMEVVDRTAPMNERGGMSITIHGAGKIYGADYIMTPEGKKEANIIVVNRETGKPTTILSEKEKYSPEDMGMKSVLTPQDSLGELNKTEWNTSLSQLTHYVSDANGIITKNEAALMDVIPLLEEKKISLDSLDNHQKIAYKNILNAKAYLNDARAALSNMFEKAYKFGTDEDKAKLKKASETFKTSLDKNKTLTGQSDAIINLVSQLGEVQPQIYAPIEEFAVDKSAKTFGNVALHAYEKYKDKAPTINIENLFPGMAFSHSEELAKLIQKSRQEFVNAAIAKGYSKSKAESQAEKMIGVTLDVGHLNIARKKGFTEKDILKEVEQIAKYVKHVHLTDNFGYSDSHLPPGMGNVPIKGILEKLEKVGYKGKKIVEAGGFVQQFGTSPFPVALEAMGSPMFNYGGQTYWNQASGLHQGYSGGFGEMLPQINYETFGAGFSALPVELGGQRPGAKGSRMSGRPME